MKHFSLLILFVILTIKLVNAQANLKPFIGLDSLPEPNTPICDIPLYLGSFFDSGLKEGDTIPDFKLYDLNGTPFHIAAALALGKPVLLVNGNYTCPVFRGKVPALNQIVAQYSSQITICVIYTLEAHPEIDISPYFGYVNTGSPNINAGILYRQPVTYGERLEIAADMLNEMDINAPVYIDGPCNEWWYSFGPAPNNAYLIGTDGVVAAKHGWFNRSPDDMLCDIEQYIDPGTNCGNSGGNFGQFSFHLLADTISYGSPGDVLYVEALLENPTSFPVNIEIKRMIENVPPGWTTAMCIDICYPPTTDYTTIQIPAGGSQLFIMDFFTSPDSMAKGMVQIGFRNLDYNQNKFIQRMYGSTELSSGTEAPELAPFPISVFPQPALNQTSILFAPDSFSQYSNLSIRVLDWAGKTMLQQNISSSQFVLERGVLSAGAYPFQILAGKNVVHTGKLVFN
ncbi:MAG: deiodinase-like protein [Saprospiraceae bacterium]